MAEAPVVVVHFKDLETDEAARESIEKRCQRLAEEFHEATRFELTLSPDGSDYTVHCHATGKKVDFSTHTTASEIAPAADSVLDKVERQLRKAHDKRIFSQRRDAQRDPPKRHSE